MFSICIKSLGVANVVSLESLRWPTNFSILWIFFTHFSGVLVGYWVTLKIEILLLCLLLANMWRWATCLFWLPLLLKFSFQYLVQVLNCERAIKEQVFSTDPSSNHPNSMRYRASSPTFCVNPSYTEFSNSSLVLRFISICCVGPFITFYVYRLGQYNASGEI